MRTTASRSALPSASRWPIPWLAVGPPGSRANRRRKPDGRGTFELLPRATPEYTKAGIVTAKVAEFSLAVRDKGSRSVVWSMIHAGRPMWRSRCRAKVKPSFRAFAAQSPRDRLAQFSGWLIFGAPTDEGPEQRHRSSRVSQARAFCHRPELEAVADDAGVLHALFDLGIAHLPGVARRNAKAPGDSARASSAR